MTGYVICSHCGYSTPRKSYCCYCSASLYQTSFDGHVIEHETPSSNHRQMIPQHTHNSVASWDNGSAIHFDIGQKLNAFRTEMHQQMAIRNKGGLRWELAGRHIFAYEVETKLDEMHGRLMNLAMDSYVEACELRAAGVLAQLKQDLDANLAQQQLVYDDTLKMRHINNSIHMLAEAWKTMEQVFLQEGQLQGLPEPLLRTILQRTYDEVYSMVFNKADSDGSRDGLFLQDDNL